MPEFYRKKRRKTGPSKNDEKVQRGLDAEAAERAAGTLATRLPGVRSLTARIAISSPQGVVLEEAQKRLAAGDAFIVEADCPGACGSGSYDFSEPIAQALSRLEESGRVSVVCEEPKYGGGPGACGCTATCEFAAELSPA